MSKEVLVGRSDYGAEGLFVSHEVDDEAGRGDEEDLHERVIQGDEVHEQIEVPHAEDDEVEFLGFG